LKSYTTTQSPARCMPKRHKTQKATSQLTVHKQRRA
jgi:hypothetical protein